MESVILTLIVTLLFIQTLLPVNECCPISFWHKKCKYSWGIKGFNKSLFYGVNYPNCEQCQQGRSESSLL